jgi:asparagine synthase (glutamine-hydrolysing)
MAHGLELRSPFLDRGVMTVAARLARAEKTAAGTTKFALREAMGLLLPREAAERPKRGFPVPIGHWFRGELSGFAEQVIREARTEDWLDKRAVLDVLRRFRAADPEVQWRQVWVLVVFSLWHQIYVERVFDPVAQGWQVTRPALSSGGSRPNDRALPPGSEAGPAQDRGQPDRVQLQSPPHPVTAQYPSGVHPPPPPGYPQQPNAAQPYPAQHTAQPRHAAQPQHPGPPQHPGQQPYAPQQPPAAQHAVPQHAVPQHAVPQHAVPQPDRTLPPRPYPPGQQLPAARPSPVPDPEEPGPLPVPQPSAQPRFEPHQS